MNKDIVCEKTKVFCVGLHKTGTTSFLKALTDEGYKVATYFGVNNPHIQEDALIQGLKLSEKYDAFQDDPWYMLYERLDEKYPGSKFVLTTRDSEKWFKSCVKYFGSESNAVREWFYGTGYDSPLGNKKRWIQRKEQHESDVREYFSNRSNDFLEIDITKGEGWEVLGPFLGLSKTSGLFPRVNTSAQQAHALLSQKYSKSKRLERLYWRLRMKLNRVMRNP